MDVAITLVQGPDPVLEQFGGIPSGGGRVWDLIFGDTRQPQWLVEVRMTEVEVGQFRCTAVRFRSVSDRVEISPKWIAKFPLDRCLRDSTLSLEQHVLDGNDADYGLPYGYPTRRNRRSWYPAFLEVVERWQDLGMKPMDVYREVARRKRVDVNRVKQWVHVAKQLRQEGTQQ